MNVPKQSIIQKAREIMPARPVTVGEAYMLAERQATRVIELLGISETPVDVARIADLPRIEIQLEPRHNMPSLAGFSRSRQRGHWLIVVNQNDSEGRRRFTLAHEFKHILDDTVASVAYAHLGYGDEAFRERQIESICDHFAACLLMPRTVVKKAWSLGLQDVDVLANDLFKVSRAAMTVRLSYLGLMEHQKRPTKDYFRTIAFDRWQAPEPDICAAGAL